ncbi:MAG: lactate racemase domain-containing protein [Candidatus Omnitrophica bacterium]|nr:lactate racemase domain-containing protein [Candidatus Omnitrophota bacterium]
MTPPIALARTAPRGECLNPESVAALMAEACPPEDYRARRILLIVPDGTRTAPVGLIFKSLHRQIAPVVRSLDVLVALGTHQPMSEDAICQRLEITPDERQSAYRRVRFFNHAWNNPAVLERVGVISSEEINALSGGLFAMEVPIEVNRLVFDYDRVIIIGPVFPHEVAGISGGNKYLFPGVGGPSILNFFHWLAAVITNPMVIGRKSNPVRRVIDRAGSMVKVDKFCFCLVVDEGGLAGVFAGTPENAWNSAGDLSRQRHIVYKNHPFHTVLSCAPPMYDELWTGGKCMYKLEPVLADGGELIIYAPHIAEICVSHRQTIEAVGYHCRDYFLKQWDRFKHYPWGVMAHCTNVFGIGTYENGIENPRARVTLATRIPPDKCRQVNLGYRDPDSIRLDDFAHRESEGFLLVPKAGEMLYQLANPPRWAGGPNNEAKP